MRLTLQQRLKQHNKVRSRRAQQEANLRVEQTLLPLGIEVSQFSHCEFHECRVSADLFAQGRGQVIISRRLSLGRVVFASFLLDISSLGVKHASLKRASEAEYEAHVTMLEWQLGPTQVVLPEYACGLVVRVAEHAAWLGFAPHRSYAGALPILSGVDVSGQHFALERDHQPLPLPMPHDTTDTQHHISYGLESRLAADRFISAW